ncbi:MAG: hypothetical protein LH481_14265 [Burkholderiales bacterium]|nr:hypothetical protein [Burkholderiales bacterium]
MQTAQINSPRFSYQAAAPMAARTPHTLDDFRAVHGSYAGSFSGKSRQPLWIGVGMIALVASIAMGVNMYSESHSAKIETAASAPTKRVLTEPTAPAIVPTQVEAPVAKEIAPAETLPAPAATAAPANTVAPKTSVAPKPAPVVTRKAAQTPAAPTRAVMAPPPEVVPPQPAIVEPAPTPPPIVIEPPAVPTPTPMPPPEVPADPSKL